MIDTQFALFPLHADEETTCQSIAQDVNSTITVMPTHHINEVGDFMGFRYQCDQLMAGNTLPVVRTMFHGTTMVQCDVSEKTILELMLKTDDIKAKMHAFLTKIDQDCVPAELSCIPENTGVITSSGTVQGMGLRTVDSKYWTPELPDRIGLYHAYIRGYKRDVRTHRLFIICTGGLNKACDQFCNLIIDVGDKWTANEVYESEEAWWLRKACHRARCQLIKMVADLFNLNIPHVEDIQAYQRTYMAIPTTETLIHDMGKMTNGQIAVYNNCIDTTKNINGILCNMHPTEGVWLFKGSHKGSCYGSMFGHQSQCGVFPVAAPAVKRSESIVVQDTPSIVRLKSKSTKESYMCFDEAVFKVLETMQWNRDNGVEALIPIVVGMH